jgi:uncharacterized membrane protein
MRTDARHPLGTVAAGASSSAPGSGAYTPPAGGATSRVASIDIARGGVMVLMALDHVRDYVTSARVQPENLAQASAALFATRWVTHFCAPAFALLAGVGIGLSMHRGKPAGAMSRFLVVRGIWLVILDLVITAAAWQFGLRLIPAFALVLWALGLSMLVMAALIHLPKSIVAAGSLVMIAAHNYFDAVRPDAWGALAPLWHVLHVPGFAIPGKLFIAYPLIPWVAVMALGWVLADVYRWEAARRRTFLLRVGLAATALFVVIRAINGYGDPAPWSEQRSAALTVASFLNARKYPPSLDFLLMTLGPALVALALVEGVRHRAARWLSVYGQVPLFYYVVHICLAHALAIALAVAQGGELRRMSIVHDPGSIPDWYGVPLPGVYVAWLLVVVAMYPLCRRFARLKRERRDWWLSYL